MEAQKEKKRHAIQTMLDIKQTLEEKARLEKKDVMDVKGVEVLDRGTKLVREYSRMIVMQKIQEVVDFNRLIEAEGLCIRDRIQGKISFDHKFSRVSHTLLLE